MALHAPSAARALATPHMLVVSLATTDLRAELEPRRSGEDNRITIELHRERRRNLDDDFGAADATHVGQAARTLTSLRTGGGGCMVLTPHLWKVVWPHKFWPHLPEKYDGSVSPAEFL
jgi:hypothetical protein